MIDGIDVVATLVPEEDVWQFEATETCNTETQMQDGEQESIAVVDHEDPRATEAIEAHDARTGEKLDSEEVRKGRAKEVRELDELEVKMEVDESEMRLTPAKRIWSKWVETRKDPNSSAIRCRLCATEVNTSESRSDTFAATPPLKFVRLILSWAASYKPKRANASMIITVFDISVAFFHGEVRKVIYVVPPQRTFARKRRSGDCSRVSTELVTRVKCLRRTWRKDSTIMVFREMRWCHVCTGAQCWKHLVCTGETISSLAFQMTGRTISNN